jgi:hypothetical protein
MLIAPTLSSVTYRRSFVDAGACERPLTSNFRYVRLIGESARALSVSERPKLRVGSPESTGASATAAMVRPAVVAPPVPVDVVPVEVDPVDVVPVDVVPVEVVPVEVVPVVEVEELELVEDELVEDVEVEVVEVEPVEVEVVVVWEPVEEPPCVQSVHAIGLPFVPDLAGYDVPSIRLASQGTQLSSPEAGKLLTSCSQSRLRRSAESDHEVASA